MKKIYFDADLDKRTFEGRTSLARKLKAFLEAQGFEFTNDPAEADLLHFHSSGVMKSYHAYQLKKRYKKPCVYTLYSNSQTEPINHIRNFQLQKKVLEKGATNGLLSYSAVLPLSWRSMFLRKLDKVIVPLNDIKKRMKAKNTEVIRFGIDTTKFVPQEEKENQQIRVAFFGHPGVFKGQTDFVEASKIFAENIQAEMYFSKWSEMTAEYIKRENPKIEIFGHVEDIVKTYNKMDIIVLPYRNPLGAIANPLVVLEAMACEKPVITTNLSFLTEMVQDTAVTVDAYNPKAIAEAVNKLAKDKEERKRLGKIGREHVVKEYELKTMFQKTLELYNSLLQ